MASLIDTDERARGGSGIECGRFRYFFDEALASLWRGYKTGAHRHRDDHAAFVVLGGFLILTANMERVFTRWQEAAEFSVYLTDSATPDQRAAIEKTLRDSAVVAARRGRLQGRGAAALQAELRGACRGGRRRCREPASGVGRGALAARAPIPPTSRRSRRRRQGSPGVADVRYDRQWIQRLMHAVGLVRAGGFALAALLVFAAALTVASVVRLALLARREEIHIMQLVGAPIAYIQGPFVVEGLIQGGVGRGRRARSFCGSHFWSCRSRADAWLAGAIDPAAARISVDFRCRRVCWPRAWRSARSAD